MTRTRLRKFQAFSQNDWRRCKHADLVNEDYALLYELSDVSDQICMYWTVSAASACIERFDINVRNFLNTFIHGGMMKQTTFEDTCKKCASKEIDEGEVVAHLDAHLATLRKVMFSEKQLSAKIFQVICKTYKTHRSLKKIAHKISSVVAQDTDWYVVRTSRDIMDTTLKILTPKWWELFNEFVDDMEQQRPCAWDIELRRDILERKLRQIGTEFFWSCKEATDLVVGTILSRGDLSDYNSLDEYWNACMEGIITTAFAFAEDKVCRSASWVICDEIGVVNRKVRDIDERKRVIADYIENMPLDHIPAENAILRQAVTVVSAQLFRGDFHIGSAKRSYTRRCNHCECKEHTYGVFFSCIKCHTPYCSAECQRKDWNDHKHRCASYFVTSWSSDIQL
ncbi:hypothetical protein CYMTET_44635 [Cymbomonas tetramitiformis]|uniref:MYND-type domain-containing protein n=1 Tax=Cymbomonas tetramitiformis TaxID=36881 RepID=A0AAE0EZD4_9CHLO|nr:hypothetical protein CYMTET_44635 [Cymbomonas tetramitiformis]